MAAPFPRQFVRLEALRRLRAGESLYRVLEDLDVHLNTVMWWAGEEWLAEQSAEVLPKAPVTEEDRLVQARLKALREAEILRQASQILSREQVPGTVPTNGLAED